MRRVGSWCALLVVSVVVGVAPSADALPTPEPTAVEPMLVVGGPLLRAGHATTALGFVTASGHALAGASVHLMMETYGSAAFTDVGVAVSDADGRLQLPTPVLWHNTSFRWDYAGDAGHDPSTSSAWQVPVSAVVSIRVSDRTPRVGQRVVVRGETTPHRAGRRVSVWTGIRPCWCDVFYPAGTPAPRRLVRGVVRDDGSYRLVIRFGSSGRKRIYALVGGGSGNVAGTSAFRHLRVG